MLIGILSDSHDHHAHVIRAIDILNEHRVEAVFHAGDIISPFVVKKFGELNARPFIATYGNNDGEKLILRTAMSDIGGEIHEYCYKTELAGKKIYMTHTQHNIEEIAAGGMYDLVIYGHTHQQDIRTVGKTLIINPGEVTDWITGQSHLVVLDLKTMNPEIIRLN